MNKDKTYTESPLPYMGNKYKLLKQIIPLFPKKCETFLDAFGGSGVVALNYNGNKITIYNEFNANIYNLIDLFKRNDTKELDKYFLDLIDKFGIKEIKKEDTNYAELRKGYYLLRDFYNNNPEKDYRVLYILICYSMNHLIRFNKNNGFNASVGHLQRYRGNLTEECHNKLQNIFLCNEDFFKINFKNFKENDFIYLDPPYLNTAAVYNEKRAFGGWNKDCDLKLFSILEELNSRNVKWALSNVFINRGISNEHLIEWCNKNNWNVYHLQRNYNPFGRGNSNNDEVLITNYNQE
jgi:DNA adenine methylase Dam